VCREILKRKKRKRKKKGEKKKKRHEGEMDKEGKTM